MSVLLLSCFVLLLLFIVAPLREPFVTVQNPVSVPVSPTLVNLMTPTQRPEPVRVNTLARAQEVCQNRPHYKTQSKCPKCPQCPDMSQYIRLDEIPCWNCSLP